MFKAREGKDDFIDYEFYDAPGTSHTRFHLFLYHLLHDSCARACTRHDPRVRDPPEHGDRGGQGGLRDELRCSVRVVQEDTVLSRCRSVLDQDGIGVK